MKLTKAIFLLLAAMFVVSSCDDDNDSYKIYDVSVSLVYPDEYEALENVSVTLVNTTTSVSYTSTTTASGVAEFKVAAGLYSVSASETRANDGISFLLNGVVNFSVTGNWDAAKPVELPMTATQKGSIVIKELYTGGCQKDDGSGGFKNDAYVILYNNSDIELTVENLAFATAIPYNSTTSNKYYTNGKLSYEDEGWIPAGTAIWYFPQSVTIESGKQIVIALKNAVDNTVTYSKSINFANPEYYCTYDVSGQFSNISVYPSPAAEIPSSHYLKAAVYGSGSAWPISILSPTFFLFTTKNTTPEAFAADATNKDDYFGTPALVSAKVPVDWILDGLEVKAQGVEGYKRLTPAVDAGYVSMIKENGFTIYRNVDKEATESISENAGKLVYNYSLGTSDKKEGTTDPSGIDAEASIRNGARIIYKDTNNSTNDFHQRSQASLRD